MSVAYREEYSSSSLTPCSPLDPPRSRCLPPPPQTNTTPPAAAAMAFSARRSLASSLSHHLNRRLYPSASHLVSSHNDHSESPSSSSTPPPTHQFPSFPSALRRPPGSQSTHIPFPFGFHLGAHRNFSTTPPSTHQIGVTSDVLSDAAPTAGVDFVGDSLSEAASSVAAAFPAPFPGEVAAAAADSYPPVAALQHLIDGVHTFTGLNWWASIAVTTLLIRIVTVPLMVNQMKSTIKLNAMRPEIEAINMEMRTSTDPQSMLAGKKKLGELFVKHGVNPLTPLKGLLIQGPIFISFFYAIQNMVEKVPSMKGGGAYWFTDLTTPDELFILPVTTALTFLAMVELGMQDGMEGNPMQLTMKKFFRVFAVLSIPFTMSFPKAIFFYWAISNFFSLGYSFVIKQPAVRNYFNIPIVVPEPMPAQMPAFNLFGGAKPMAAVDSPLASKGSEESSSSGLSDRDRIIDLEKKIAELEREAKARGKSQE